MRGLLLDYRLEWPPNGYFWSKLSECPTALIFQPIYSYSEMGSQLPSQVNQPYEDSYETVWEM